jgi:hypothetical protein
MVTPNITCSSLLLFIQEAKKQGWKDETILGQINSVCLGVRDIRISDLCIILLDGFQTDPMGDPAYSSSRQ